MTITVDRELLATTRAEYVGILETRERPASEFELREVPNGTGGTDLLFRGYACVTDAEYEMEDWLGPWVESVTRGAFAKTLSEGPDVAFLVNHGGMTLARTKPGTLQLSEDGIGLLSEARLDPRNSQVMALRSAVERGDIDEMSFAFRVTRQEWDEDYTRRFINEVSIHHGDVSPVNFGANPHTGGTVSIRSKRSNGEPDPASSDAADTERVLHAIRQLHGGGKLDLEALSAVVTELREPAPPASEDIPPASDTTEEPTAATVDPEEVTRMKAQLALAMSGR